MNAAELRAAAGAMNDEADRLEALHAAATAAPWLADSTEIYHQSEDPGDFGLTTWVGETCNIDLPNRDDNADLIAHRRNTLARDAATLRATAEAVTELAAVIDRNVIINGVDRQVVAVARAFLGGLR
jgi:hypothetical protein